MTPEWKDAFKYATTLADQLGLEMAIAGSPGLERERRAVGHARAGDEEVRVERDARRGRTPVHRRRCPSRPRRPGPTRTRPAARGGFGGGRPQTSRRRPSSTPTPPSSPIARRTATVAMSATAAQGDLERRHVRPSPPSPTATWRRPRSCRPLRSDEKAWIQYRVPAGRRPSAALTFITAAAAAESAGAAAAPPPRQLEASDDGQPVPRRSRRFPAGARTDRLRRR